MEKRQLVSYYDDGWRWGFLEEEHDNKSKIQPIGALGIVHKSIWVRTSDTIPEEAF